MKKPISIILRVAGVLLLLALIGGGAFRFGYTRGLADSPAIASQMQAWQDGDGANAAPFFYRGFDGPMQRGGFAPYMLPHGHFGFNPFGKLLGFLFFALLFVGAVRFIFFKRMMHHGWHGHTPPWAQQPAPQAPGQPEAPQEETK